MKAIIKPSVLHGSAVAPPSKSFAHRSIICSALADGKSRISNLSESQDLLATLDCVSVLGATVKRLKNGAEITGIVRKNSDGIILPCRESGSTLRFLIPIACALYDSSVFTGSPRLIERGIGVYEDIFKDSKITISKTSESVAFSGRLNPGVYKIPGNISSQFVSGLLFSLPLLSGDSKVIVTPPVESKPYIDITISVLAEYGIEISEYAENSYSIKGNQKYRKKDTIIEGDWSNSAVFFVLNALGSDILVSGLLKNSLQGDRIIESYIEKLKNPAEAVDISSCPDLAPLLFAFSAMKNGAEFIGTKRLKIKESDRAAAMRDELIKFGVETKLYDNRAVISGSGVSAPSDIISSHNDHRIAMACTLLLSKTGGTIDGIEAVSKSFPDFFAVLSSLGLEVTYET